jgi:RNA methyltransferase, TrmH family
LTGLAYRHQRVQRLRRLVGRRSARKDEGRFVIEGVNLLEEALGSQVPIEAVYVDGAWAGSTNEGRGPGEGGLTGGQPRRADPDTSSNGRLSALLDRCLDVGARVFELEPGVLARVTDTVTPQPVVAVVETPSFVLPDIRSLSPQLIVVCVDVRDPGNAGTVVRSAWAAGVDAVLFCEGAVDPWNPKAVRSSAGAVLHVPVVTAGPPAGVLQEVGGWGLRRLAAVRDGGEDYATVDLTVPSALVLGNEAAGLPVELVSQDIDGCVSIPMPGGAESLNVGMAAAVLCFEACRQRRLGPPDQAGADATALSKARTRGAAEPK